MKLQQWRWRYGFSHYTTGRVLKFAGYAKFKIEVRDRTLARTGPHSGLILLSSSGGTEKKQKKTSSSWGDELVFATRMCSDITSSVRGNDMNACEVSIFVK